MHVDDVERLRPTSASFEASASVYSPPGKRVRGTAHFTQVTFCLGEPARRRLADEVHLVSTPRERVAELGGDDAAAAKSSGSEADPAARGAHWRGRRPSSRRTVHGSTMRHGIVEPNRAAKAGRPRTRSWGSPSGQRDVLPRSSRSTQHLIRRCTARDTGR